MTKCLPRIRQQLKNDNRGASLVTVVVVAALVLIMVTVLLSMVLFNYYMKNQNIKSQKNFYDAESAMEEIRLGLTKEVSGASGAAYASVLSDYNDLTEQEKEEQFQKEFFKEMQTRLEKDNTKTLYNCELLASFLKGEGAAFETSDDGVSNALDDKTLEAGNRCMVLRNVKVSYKDAEDNYSEIQTDIDINYPQIDFSNAGSRNNLLCYALLAGEDGDVSVVAENAHAGIFGNVYLGTKQTRVSDGTVTFSKLGNATNYAIGGELVMTRGNMEFNNMETWTKNILVSKGASFSSKGADTYLQNDLVLSGDSTRAVIEDGFYAYGNPQAVKTSKSYRENLTKNNGDNIQKALSANEADFSSSIILDGGKTSKLDLSRVNNLMIAGTSYINTTKSKHPVTDGVKNKSIETGQSVMTTSDQRAYLIPGELIGKGYENGGANPMTAQMYQSLKQDIMNDRGYEQESQITAQNFVDFSGGDSSLGISLQSLGVSGYDVSAIQVSGVGSMYYFFMKFDSQTDRNNFVKKYYGQQNHYSKLQENLEDYAGGDVKLPESSDNEMNFYLQGNAIATGGSSLLISDTLARETQDVQEKEADFSDNYMGLLAKLEQNYDSLTTAEKKNALFDNVIEKDSIAGSDKYFVSTNGVGAVVTGEDIKVSTAAKNIKKGNVVDANGENHPEATINLIISEKNVVVDEDFQGLIICKGSITLKGSNLQIKADANKVSRAFFNSETPGGESPADYLKEDIGRYMIGGMKKETGDKKKSAEAVRLLDSVTYSNWEKH